MAWYSYRPYVSVAERRHKGEAAARRLAKKTGRVLAPVRPAGKGIAATFWGKAWCKNLDAYSDFANRLPRGRTYLRNGSIIDLQITAGRVEALVQGTDLYQVAINFKPLTNKRWQTFKQHAAGQVTHLLDLLQGRLPPAVLAAITTRDSGLFPTPKEIELGCSCPDWAAMCKHVAAVLYGVGVRLDEMPELFFVLRGVDSGELMKAATASAVRTSKARGPTVAAAFDDSALSEIFGVEIESELPVHAPRTTRSKKQPTAKRASTPGKRKASAKAKPVANTKRAAKLKPVATAKRRKPRADH